MWENKVFGVNPKFPMKKWPYLQKFIAMKESCWGVFWSTKLLSLKVLMLLYVVALLSKAILHVYCLA